MKRKILVFFITILIGVGVIDGTVMAAPVTSEGLSDYEAGVTSDDYGECDKRILGLRAWYYGIAEGTNCEVNISNIEDVIGKIIGNVVYDLFRAVGYVGFGYMLYGGFLYLISSGDVNKAAKAKRTIIGAVIGMTVGLVAAAIVEFVMDDILGVMGSEIPQVNSAVVINDLLNGIYGIAGLVAVCMIIYGGVEYMMSMGNSQQVVKAKNILMYSIIGLVVVLAAYAITYFVMKGVIGS